MSDQEQPERPPEEGGRPSRGTSLSLLERARDQDAAAWRRLVYLYKPLVMFWCGRSGVRFPDGEDVAQEVFLVVASRLAEFDRTGEGASFRAWLRAITRNVLRTHWRNGQRQPHAAGGSSALEILHEVVDPTSALEADDPAPELKRLYLRALELVRCEFEEHTWRAFWQVAVDGLTPTEAAAALKMSPAAVRQAKSRVLRRLKEEVGDLAK